MYKHLLVLNNLQRLMNRKTQQTDQLTNQTSLKYFLRSIYTGVKLGDNQGLWHYRPWFVQFCALNNLNSMMC